MVQLLQDVELVKHFLVLALFDLVKRDHLGGSDHSGGAVSYGEDLSVTALSDGLQDFVSVAELAFADFDEEVGGYFDIGVAFGTGALEGFRLVGEAVQ